MSRAFDARVREARSDLGTREAEQIDWDAFDGRLFQAIDRVEQEERVRRVECIGAAGAQGARGRRAWAWGSALVLALTVAALIIGKTRDLSPLDQAQEPLDREEDGGLAVRAGGRILVNGHPALDGSRLRPGDVLETRERQATLERTGKVVLLLEQGTRATIEPGHGKTLVLRLATGAVEAQVEPVASGEAFAIDVGRARVAVHGTHLRVERHADEVTVDLARGVVAIGDAPRAGPTYGALLTAPAHAQFAASAAEATLRLTHDSAAVRPSVPLSTAPVVLEGAHRIAVPEPAQAQSSMHEAAAAGRATRAPGHSRAHAPSTPSTLSTTAVADAQSALAGELRRCIGTAAHARGVTLLVDTTLHLMLNGDGSVRSARFDPPVAPEVNSCASSAIYQARFGHGGSVDVPVGVRLPASSP